MDQFDDDKTVVAATGCLDLARLLTDCRLLAMS
jgi:hypothetical protein